MNTPAVIRPVTAAYHGTYPVFGDDLVADPGAVVLGRATIGARARLGAWSVLRADGHDVRLGNDVFIGARSTVHIAHDEYPAIVGDHVSAGTNTVIHACTVGDDCAFEDNVVILDGAEVASGAVLTAGSIVFPRNQLDGGWIYAGLPAKPVRELAPGERDAFHDRIRSAAGDGEDRGDGDAADIFFLAPTARVRGGVEAGPDVSIWYGCLLDAGSGRISVGHDTNIQDNSVLLRRERDVSIGARVTIGHNVTLTDSDVADDSLIGIGAVLAPGTMVEEDVLVAAGAETEPGQRLTAGQVWAGRPARPLAPLDDAKRAMMTETIPTYRGYAGEFRSAAHG